MSRKLVTVRKVKNVSKIEGADFIERCTVDGWDVIVKKGEFKENDLGLFFEIDSVLPDDERYKFLKKMTNTSKGMGYRLRTIKLRKQISQGLMLPFSAFEGSDSFNIGDDLTDTLGVWLYEPVHQGGSRANSECKSIGKKIFPDFLRKTDQERIQNKMHYFGLYKDSEWEATKKLDGSSMTVWNYSEADHLLVDKFNKPWKNFLMKTWQKITFYFKEPETFGVCSRNINLREKEGNAFWTMANELKLRELLKDHNVALQGELIGPRIQNNHEKVDRNKFYLFDIFDIENQRYLLPNERYEWLLLNDPCGIVNVVPHYSNVKIFEKCNDVSEMQEYVNEPGMNSGVTLEGMVFKSMDVDGLSFKCINNKFLLKYEE